MCTTQIFKVFATVVQTATKSLKTLKNIIYNT